MITYWVNFKLLTVNIKDVNFKEWPYKKCVLEQFFSQKLNNVNEINLQFDLHSISRNEIP